MAQKKKKKSRHNNTKYKELAQSNALSIRRFSAIHRNEKVVQKFTRCLLAYKLKDSGFALDALDERGPQIIRFNESGHEMTHCRKNLAQVKRRC